MTNQHKKLRVGIDLGTTNSCCYYEYRGKAECLDYSDGRRILPSYVEYRDDGSIVVGSVAKRNIKNQNPHVIHNTKRLIGKEFNCPEVQAMIHSCGLPVENICGKPVFNLQDGKTITPGMVASSIVKYLLDRVEDRCGMKATDVCVTIPAHFDNNQRTATLQAIINAGIPEDSIQITNEPTAAAICYGLDNNADNTRILVYDLGGGTFDVSILSIRDGEFQIDTYEGDPNLGGADFDEVLLKWIEEKYKDRYNDDIIPEKLPEHIKLRHRRRLLEAAEKCKESLSSSIEENYFEAQFTPKYKPSTADDEDEYRELVTLSDLNTLLEDYINRTLNTVKKAMSNLNLTERDIDHVVLVGGSSRLKLVHQKLEEMFGSQKLKESVNPDECVAKGACLYLMNNSIIKERIAYALGKTLIHDDVMCVIPRLSELPATYSVLTYTSRDYQKEVESTICETQQEENGNVIPFGPTCVKLAPYNFTGFRPAKAGEVKFRTTFTIKTSGIVYVTVVETKTKKVLLQDERIQYKE